MYASNKCLVTPTYIFGLFLNLAHIITIVLFITVLMKSENGNTRKYNIFMKICCCKCSNTFVDHCMLRFITGILYFHYKNSTKKHWNSEHFWKIAGTSYSKISTTVGMREVNCCFRNTYMHRKSVKRFKAKPCRTSFSLERNTFSRTYRRVLQFSQQRNTYARHSLSRSYFITVW